MAPDSPPEAPPFPPFSAEVDPQVLALGVRPHFFAVRNLPRLGIDEKCRTKIEDAALAARYEAWRKRVAEGARTTVCVDSTDDYGRFFRNANGLLDIQKDFPSGRDAEFIPAPFQLREFALRNRGKVPKIHPVVDAYNAVSLQTGLALGAHNITPMPLEQRGTAHIVGPVRLRMTREGDTFIPLGEDRIIPVPPGLYAYVDDCIGEGGRVLCLLVAKQCGPTRITPATESAFFIVQSGAGVSDEQLLDAQSQVENHLIEVYGSDVLQFETVATSPYSR